MLRAVNLASETEGGRSVGVTKSWGTREVWTEGKGVSFGGHVWKHLAEELLDQDGKLWRVTPGKETVVSNRM